MRLRAHPPVTLRTLHTLRRHKQDKALRGARLRVMPAYPAIYWSFIPLDAGHIPESLALLAQCLVLFIPNHKHHL